MKAEAQREAVSRRITEHHASKQDWKAVCGYCKQALVGTSQELLDHRCKEYEESNESAS